MIVSYLFKNVYSLFVYSGYNTNAVSCLISNAGRVLWKYSALPKMTVWKGYIVWFGGLWKIITSKNIPPTNLPCGVKFLSSLDSNMSFQFSNVLYSNNSWNVQVKNIWIILWKEQGCMNMVLDELAGPEGKSERKRMWINKMEGSMGEGGRK